MRAGLLVPALILLVACSDSSSGGAIEPDPSASVAASTSTGQLEQEDENLAADVFMQRLPGEYDNRKQVEALGLDTTKQVFACRLDAPELGSRVVYIERSDVGREDAPDRQLVLHVHEVGPEYYTARARAYEPASPEAWIGLCSTATTPRMPTEVVEMSGCDRTLAYAEGPLATGATGASMPPTCVPGGPANADTSTSGIGAMGVSVTWIDGHNVGEDVTRDPTFATSYEMDRRGKGEGQ